MEIIETSDLKSVRFAVQIGVDAREVVLVFGVPGTGKTVAMKDVSKKHEGVLIEAFDRINILEELCRKFGLETGRPNKDRFAAVRDALSRSPVPVFIDEAEKVSYLGLEWVRRLYDFCTMPVIMAGTETLYENWRGAKGQRAQLYRRVRGKWHMNGMTDQEQADVCARFGYQSPEAIRTMAGNNIDKTVNILTKMRRFAENLKIDINEVNTKEVARFIIL